MGDANVVQGGWVYVVKGEVQRAGAEVLPRFMTLAYQTLSLFKRNPQTSPSEEPTFSGVLSQSTTVEELGRKVLPSGQVLHLFSFAESSTAPRKVQIGCSAAEAAHDWVNALESATELDPGSSGGAESSNRGMASSKNSVLKFVPIGGAQVHPSGPPAGAGPSRDDDDENENIRWRLIRLVNGLRIFEGYPIHWADWSPGQRLLKAEGVVEAEPDRIFEIIMNLSEASRTQWDPLTETAEVLEVQDGFTDIIKATYLTSGKWNKHTMRELVAKRSWCRNGDGSYVISFWPDEASTKHLSAEKSQRVESTIYTWDIVPLSGHTSSGAGSFRSMAPGESYSRSLVRYVLEVQQKASHSKFRLPFFKSSDDKKKDRERAVSVGAASPSTREKERERDKEREQDSLAEPGALEEFADGVALASLGRIAGLREYFASLPRESHEGLFGDMVDASAFSGLMTGSQKAGPYGGEEFFDALELSVISDVDAQKRAAARKRWARIKWLVRFGLLIQSLSDSMEATGLSWNIPRELLHNCPPVDLSTLGLKLSALGSVPRLDGDAASSAHNACRDPGGGDFTVRGPNYLSDRLKVAAGDPLLKLVGMDWFSDPNRIDNVAARPGCLVQSEAGKAMPFMFVVNLQVPGPPNYSLVAYFASDRPVRAHPRSLLHRFFTSTDDEFRNARFKLIPRISEGHWMVKRAVGSKAAILGRALKCKYFRGRNYLEMDCDIGSSSVARNVIGLVISYVTSLIVDLVFLIEAQEAEDLPEYLLGAFTCIKLDTKKAVAPPPEAEAVPEEKA